MVGKSVDNNDDENYETLPSGIEKIKRNSKYLSNRQQMEEQLLSQMKLYQNLGP
jgi:hypothetical protein